MNVSFVGECQAAICKNPGDLFWENISYDIDILSLLPFQDSGTYRLEVYFQGFVSDGKPDIFDNRLGNNYVATFKVEGCPPRAGFNQVVLNLEGQPYQLIGENVDNFNNTFLGDVDCTSEYLMGALATTFQNDGKQINEVIMWWRIYSVQENMPPPFRRVPFSFEGEDANEQRSWKLTPPVDALSTDNVFLDGMHRLEIYFEGIANGGF